jgi:hypothetical protein
MNLKAILLAFLVLLVSVPGYAAEVHISDPAPLFCGSGVVRLNGIALVPVNDQYKVLKVYFKDCTTGCTIGESDVVLTQTLAQDGKVKSWEAFVTITEGHKYTINAVMRNVFDGGTSSHTLVMYPAAACTDAELQELIDLAEDRLE